MPLIKEKQQSKKVSLKAYKIDNDILERASKYCEWANISDLGFMIEEALLHVFKADKEWKKHEKMASTQHD